MANIAVVGAGVVGTATATWLAHRGHRVTVYERFGLDHDRGSSYGSSRIIRRTYPDPVHTALMAEAFEAWRQVEVDAGEVLLKQVGGAFFGVAGGHGVREIAGALHSAGVPHTAYDAADAMRRFPGFRFRADEAVVWEPGAGFLRASACVHALARLAVAAGATIRDRACEVTLVPSSSGVAVRTEDGTEAMYDAVAVAAGPWAARVLAKWVVLPLTVTRQVYVHLDAEPALARCYAMDAFPVWIDFDALYYGFPSDGETSGVKLAHHQIGAPCDPDTVDRTVHDVDRKHLQAYAGERLPGLRPDVVLERVCLYTNTPDEAFVVDTVPGDTRIAYVAGLSGHGFKFGALLGRVLGGLVAGERSAIEPSHWALARFGRH